MPRDLIEGLLGYIKGPSYFKHFLIGTIGSDSASARLSGASRYIFTIATGSESNVYAYLSNSAPIAPPANAHQWMFLVSDTYTRLSTAVNIMSVIYLFDEKQVLRVCFL